MRLSQIVLFISYNANLQRDIIPYNTFLLFFTSALAPVKQDIKSVIGIENLLNVIIMLLKNNFNFLSFKN
jgi:hypothetical protein